MALVMVIMTMIMLIVTMDKHNNIKLRARYDFIYNIYMFKKYNIMKLSWYWNQIKRHDHVIMIVHILI